MVLRCAQKLAECGSQFRFNSRVEVEVEFPEDVMNRRQLPHGRPYGLLVVGTPRQFRTSPGARKVAGGQPGAEPDFRGSAYSAESQYLTSLRTAARQRARGPVATHASRPRPTPGSRRSIQHLLCHLQQFSSRDVRARPLTTVTTTGQRSSVRGLTRKKYRVTSAAASARGTRVGRDAI